MRTTSAIPPRLLKPVTVSEPKRRYPLDQGILRFQYVLKSLIFNDINFEGHHFTLPEVTTLVDGGDIYTQDELGVKQVAGLTEAVEFIVQTLTNTGQFALTLEYSGPINSMIARSLAIGAGNPRNISGVNPENCVHVNAKGDQFDGYRGLDLPAVYDDMMFRFLAECSHPYEAALNYCAYSSYAQYFGDGNKRTSRYTMNGYLIANGYSPIMIPVSERKAYESVLHSLFMGHDFEPYVRLLDSCQLP